MIEKYHLDSLLVYPLVLITNIKGKTTHDFIQCLRRLRPSWTSTPALQQGKFREMKKWSSTYASSNNVCFFHLFVYLFIYSFIYIFIYLFIYLFLLCIYIYIHVEGKRIKRFTHIYKYIYICLSVCLSTNSIHLHIYLILLSICSTLLCLSISYCSMYIHMNHMRVSINGGTPIAGWFIVENPM